MKTFTPINTSSQLALKNALNTHIDLITKTKSTDILETIYFNFTNDMNAVTENLDAAQCKAIAYLLENMQVLVETGTSIKMAQEWADIQIDDKLAHGKLSDEI